MNRLLAYLHLSPEEPAAGAADAAGAAAPETQAVKGPLTREDGIVIPAGLAHALQKAGKDPMTLSANEILEFSNQGTVKFYDDMVKEKKGRLDAEAKAREASGKLGTLTIEQLIGDATIPAETREKLQGVLQQSQRMRAIEGLVQQAVSEGLLYEAAGNAILSADQTQATTIFGLVKQLAEKENAKLQVAGASIGAGIATPSAGADKVPESVFGTMMEERANDPATKFAAMFRKPGQQKATPTK